MPSNPSSFIQGQHFLDAPPPGYWFLSVSDVFQPGDLEHHRTRGEIWRPVPATHIDVSVRVINGGQFDFCRKMEDIEPTAAPAPDHAAIKRHLERLS